MTDTNLDRAYAGRCKRSESGLKTGHVYDAYGSLSTLQFDIYIDSQTLDYYQTELSETGKMLDSLKKARTPK
ncbi:MAG: hypothetical protein WCQ99_04045 [Pseudomonadota bacterium]